MIFFSQKLLPIVPLNLNPIVNKLIQSTDLLWSTLLDITTRMHGAEFKIIFGEIQKHAVETNTEITILRTSDKQTHRAYPQNADICVPYISLRILTLESRFVPSKIFAL